MIEENRQSVSFFLTQIIFICQLPSSALYLYVLFQKLRRKDQLLQEANKGEVFNGYTEGALKFKPTYKYDVGSSIYDTSSHKVSLNWHHVQDGNFVDMSQYIGKIHAMW
jgi:hypothetical protein